MRRIILTVFAAAISTAVALAATGYHVIGDIQIGGEGGWDYLTVDSAARRLYVSHAHARRGRRPRREQGRRRHSRHAGRPRHRDCAGAEPRVHQQRPWQQRDDLRSEDAEGDRARCATGENPDASATTPVSSRVFAFNGRSKNATAIDAKTGKVAGTIALPRQARVLRGRRQRQRLRQHRGHERNRRDRRGEGDGDEEVRADRMRRPFGPGHRCEEPQAVLGLRQPRDGRLRSRQGQSRRDAGDRRGLRRRRVRSGHRLRVQLERRRHDDRRATDAAASGTSLENIATERGARTIALDEKTHQVYLPTAKTAPGSGGGRATYLPDTFKVLVVGK